MKYLLSLFLITSLILVGCTTTEVGTTEEEEPELTVFQEHGDKKIVNTSSIASCFQVELRDLNDNKIDVPQEILNSFNCFGAATALSPDANYLVYDNYSDDENPELKIYSFDSAETKLISDFQEGLEGLKCIWNDLGSLLACASINQEGYEGSTMFHIYHFENGEIIKIQEYKQKYEEMLDFTCGAECYPGNFWFENENTLKYEGHNIVAPNLEFEIKF